MRLLRKTWGLWWLFMLAVATACGADVKHVGVPSPPPPARPPAPAVDPQVLPATPRPPELNLLFTFGAPERDLKRLATLIPDHATDLLGAIDSFRQTLGSGIGKEVDLHGPSVLSVGLGKTETVAFAVALRRSNFGADLPPTLQLTPKSKGVESLHATDGSHHDWIGAKANCDVYRAVRPSGAIVCAPKDHEFDTLGPYTGKVAEQLRNPVASLRMDVFPSFFTEALGSKDDTDLNSQIAHGLLSPVVGNIDRFGLLLDFSPTGMVLRGSIRFQATSDPFSTSLLGPTPPGRALPPEFVELPSDALLGYSMTGVDPKAIASAGHEFWRAFEPLLAATPGFAEGFGTLTRLIFTGGPLGIAYGVDLAAAKARLEAWVAADEADPSGSAKPGSFVPTADWWLLRMDEEDARRWDPALKFLASNKITFELIKYVEHESKEDKKLGAAHLVLDLDEPLHVLVGPRSRSLVIAISRDEVVARRALRQALEPGPSTYHVYFRPAAVRQAAGLGFVRPEIFSAGSIEYRSSFERKLSLSRLQKLLRAPEPARLPASIEYQVDRSTTPARGNLALAFRNESLSVWVPEAFEALERL